MRAYSMTIDKCRTSGDYPTKVEYEVVFNYLLNTHALALTSWPVRCYELKVKLNAGIKDWLHFHACVWGRTYLDYKDVKAEGYSIKIELLKTSYDIINWCGYVNKDKIDRCDLTIKPMEKVVKSKRSKRPFEHRIKMKTILEYYK